MFVSERMDQSWMSLICSLLAVPLDDRSPSSVLKSRMVTRMASTEVSMTSN